MITRSERCGTPCWPGSYSSTPRLNRCAGSFRVTPSCARSAGSIWRVVANRLLRHGGTRVFLNSLLEHHETVEAIFGKLLWQMSSELPDLGQYLAIDGKAIDSHARKHGRCDSNDSRGEHDASGGTKSYTVNHTDGSTERKAKHWFGFKVHTIVDTTYELPVAFDVTPASKAEQPLALDLIDQLKENQPLVLETAEYFMADRGYDDGKLHRRLWDAYGIKPVIATSGRTSTSGVRPLSGCTAAWM